MYGTITFRTSSGASRTLTFERGTIESVTGSTVTVRAADGRTMTWDLVSNTVVRQQGTKTRITVSKLTANEQVFVGGPVVNGANDARLVVIRTSSATSPATGA